MTGRILCIGTGNPLTSPRPHWGEGKIYKYAPPGKCLTYGQGGMKESECDPRYGLLVVEDFIIQELKAQVLPIDAAPHNEFEDRLINGRERAAALVQLWSSRQPNWNAVHYGAVLIAGETPTEAEIAEGQQKRRQYAEARLTETKRGQTLRLQGKKGYKAGYDPSDREWAKEFGFVLDIALEQVQKAPNTPISDDGRVSCPKCAEMIMPQALKCRFCGSNFKTPVGEILAAEPVEAVS